MLIKELMGEIYLNKHVNIKQCNRVHSEKEGINLELQVGLSGTCYIEKVLNPNIACHWERMRIYKSRGEISVLQ